MTNASTFITGVREAVGRAFSGRRPTHTAIINGTRDEVNQRRGRDDVQTPVAQLVTPLATSYLATWTLPRLVAASAKPRSELRKRLELAQDGFVQASLAGRMFLRRPDLAIVRAEYEGLLEQSHSATNTARSHRLPFAVYVLTLVVSAVVDWPFFYGILMDAQDASPKSPDYWSTVTQSAALATLTPVLVMLLSEWGGRRLARTRWEVRQLLDDRKSSEPVGAMTLVSIFAAPIIVVLALAALVALFAVFAQHRFASLTSGPGAVAVDPGLLAILVAVVPIAAFAASVVHHDLASAHRVAITRKWDSIQAQVSRNQDAQRAAMLEWTMAWGALRDHIGRLVAEGQISIQTWEALVLRGITVANQRGETAYTVDDIAAEAPATASSTAMSIRLSTLSQRASLVQVPVPQMATTFASAGWVLDELNIDLEWLIIHAPDSTESVEKEIDSLLALAYSSTDKAPKPTADELETMFAH